MRQPKTLYGIGAALLVVLLLGAASPVSAVALNAGNIVPAPSEPLACGMNTWTTMNPGPISVLRAGAASDGRYIYLFGGQNYSTGISQQSDDWDTSLAPGEFSPQAVLHDMWRYDPYTDQWIALADMPTAKANFQGAYWNGKIYAPGGYQLTSPAYLSELAIYNIASNSWSTGAPMPLARQGTASAAYNGKIYVAGGSDGTTSYANTLYIYDITGNNWGTGAPVPVGIRYSRMITVGNYIYLIGGDISTDFTSGNVYRYDPNLNTWSSLAPLQTGRNAAELMTDGDHIYAVNGANDSRFDGIPLDQTVEIYDIAFNTWSYGHPTLQTTAAPAGGVVGNRLVILGGSHSGAAYNTVQMLQLGRNCYSSCTSGYWDLGTTGPSPRYRAGSASDGSNLYVFGGWQPNGAGVNKDFWRYDAHLNSWTQLADMPTAKANIQGAYWNGKIYVPGGYSSGTYYSELSIYDISSNAWSTGASIPILLSGASSASYGGKIYVAGGSNSPGTYSDLLYIYDISGNSWSNGASLPVGTVYSRMLRVGNYLYLVGGTSSASKATNTLFRYDPVANTWLAMAPLQTGRNGLEVMSDGVHIYAVNGGDTSYFKGNPIEKSVEVYDIASNSWSYGVPTLLSTSSAAGGLVDNKLVVVGGTVNGISTTVDSVQVGTLEAFVCYTVDTCQSAGWTTAASGPAAGFRLGSASDGRYLYIFGGQDMSTSPGLSVGAEELPESSDLSPQAALGTLWRYDADNNQWLQLANMPTSKGNIQGAYWNGKIYVPGGYFGGAAIAELAIYDIASNTWTTGAPMLTGRTGASSAASNGKVYVAGGNPGPTAELVIYDIASNTWSTGSSLPDAITYGRMISVGKYIYHVGGLLSGSVTTNAVYRYDPVLDHWSKIAPLHSARSSPEVMSDGAHLFVINGGYSNNYFNGLPAVEAMEVYDIESGTWSYGPPPAQSLSASAGGRVGNRLVIVGGVNNNIAYNTVQVTQLDQALCFLHLMLPCIIR